MISINLCITILTFVLHILIISVSSCQNPSLQYNESSVFTAPINDDPEIMERFFAADLLVVGAGKTEVDAAIELLKLGSYLSRIIGSSKITHCILYGIIHSLWSYFRRNIQSQKMQQFIQSVRMKSFSRGKEIPIHKWVYQFGIYSRRSLRKPLFIGLKSEFFNLRSIESVI